MTYATGVLGGGPLGERVMEDPVAPTAVLQGDRTPGLQLGGVLPPSILIEKAVLAVFSA